MRKVVLNIIGPQLRRIRVRAGLTQDALAAQCGVWGWDMSRATLSKIEAQLRCVSDFELIALADVLKVEASDLLPTDTAEAARLLGIGRKSS